MTDPASASPTEPATGDRATARWRRVVSAVLAVLVCILTPLSVLSVWLHDTVLDTDQYVATVGPLARDPAVQEAIATRTANSLVASTDLEARVARALPPNAPVSAPAVADGVTRVVHDLSLRLVQSEQFATVWEQANRRAHTQVVAVLEGKRIGNVDTKSGRVVVHLGPLVDRLKAALSNAGIDLFDDVDAKRVNSQIVLLDSKQLNNAQGAVDVFDKLAVALPILTIVLFASAVLVSVNRRRTVLRTAMGVAFAVALLLILFNLARSAYLDALGPDVNRDAAAHVYDQLLEFLRTTLRAAFVLGIIGVIAAWLAGPGHTATGVRNAAVRLVPGHGHTTDARPSSTAAFVSRYRSPLLVMVTGIGLATLVLLSHPGPVAVLTVAVVVAVCLGVVGALGRTASNPQTPHP